jgi:FkbM family methyltransferase
MDVILDIGAYTGIYTLMGLAANQNAIAYSFEPNPQQVETLTRNCKINNFTSRVKIYNAAVGQSEGETVLFRDASHPDSTSMTTLEPGGEEIARVPIISIDGLVIPESRVLMKIDVEGYEVEVLNGSRETLIKHQPCILVEILSEANLNIWRFELGSLGYSAPILLDEKNYLFIHEMDWSAKSLLTDLLSVK